MSIPTPEQALAKRFQHEEPLSDAEFEVEKTLVRKIQEYKPKFEDFEDIYSQSEIEKDEQKLANQQAKDDKEMHQRALILEAILVDRIEKDNWLGENCFTGLASEFDDRFSHTDLILEFEQNGKIVRLAVDATIAENPEILEKKRNYIKQDIEKAELTNLKYFVSEADLNTRGKISGIPRVIIGANRELVQELSEMIINKKNKELSESFIQLSLLKAIKSQLEDEIQYAELYFRKDAKKRMFVANRHKEILEIITHVLKQKEKALGKTSEPKENIDWGGDIKSLEYLAQKGY